MSLVRRPRAARSLLVALGAAVAVLGLPAAASAEEPATSGDTIVGQLTRAWPEHRDADEAAEHGDDGPLTFVRTSAGDSVRVDSADVEQLPTGATVELTVGRPSTDEATKDDGYEKAHDVLDAEVLAPAATPAPTSPAVTPVNHQVTVAMVVPKGGARDSTTLASFVSTVNNGVADFWSEQTDGAVKFGVTAGYDWINASVGCADPYALWNEVARTVGFTAGSNKHLLLYLGENNSGCSDGLGTVGAFVSSGGFTYVRYAMPSMIAHEFGHNLTLGHSSEKQCDRSVNEMVGRSCATTSYWDLYDVMGASWEQMGSLNVAQYYRLTGATPTVVGMTSTPQTVTLAPVSQRSGLRAVALRDSAGTVYWLEYRPAAGQDAWLGTAANRFHLQPGVLLRQAAGGGDTALLLDGTPTAPSNWSADSSAALPVGSPVQLHDTWTRGTAAFVVTVQSVTASSAVVAITPTSAIDFAHQAAGGDTGVMGPAIGAETCVDRTVGGRYCARSFTNGGIYWSLVTGAHLVTGQSYTDFTAAGGATGSWGLPVTDTDCARPGGGCRQAFEKVSTYWSPGTGSAVVQAGALLAYYQAAGQETGTLGYPLAEQVCGTGWCRQGFQGGTLVTSSVGTVAVPTAIEAPWAAQGYESGPLGLPTTGLICGLRDGGCGQIFRGGRIYSTSATGSHSVSGGIQSVWAAQGAEGGALGYPTTDAVCGLTGGGCKQAFEGGAVYSSGAGTYSVSGAVAASWVAAGAEGGSLGYPTTGLICGLKNGGCGQVFQGGRIYSTSGTGAHPVTGALFTAWGAQGSEAGPLGYPAADPVCGLADGGCKQAFEGGILYSSTTAGAHPVSGTVNAAWQGAGAETGTLGYPTSGLICGLRNSGCGQVFQGGRIYVAPGTGAHALTGAVLAAWAAQGYETGSLGYARSDQVCGLPAGGCRQDFQGGSLYSTAGGVLSVSGALATAWWAAGAEGGALGAPTSGLICGLANGGCGQVFQGGRIYSSPGVGTHALSGDVATVWSAQGSETGRLGYPTTGLICGLANGGCGQAFQGGRIYSTSGTGTHALSGAIHAAWVAQGYELGPLGYATDDQVCGLAGGGCKQDFQGGTLYSYSSGTISVSGEVATAWRAAGGDGGVLGAPVTGLICGLRNSGCGQVFQGGRIYRTTATGTHLVTGAVLTAWVGQRGEAGPLGYPTGEQVCGLAGGGCKQDFQGGVVYSLPAAGTFAVSGDVGTAWSAAGAEGGALGYPTTGLICGLRDGGCGQVFQGGRVYRTDTTGAHALSGAIQAAWTAAGSEAGSLGYPTSDPYTVANGTAQDFQGGTLTFDSGTGQVTRN